MLHTLSTHAGPGKWLKCFDPSKWSCFEVNNASEEVIRLHSKRCLRVEKSFWTHFSSLESFLLLNETPAWPFFGKPFFGKPFFGTRQYCSILGYPVFVSITRSGLGFDKILIRFSPSFYCNHRNVQKGVNWHAINFHSEDDVEFKIISERFWAVRIQTRVKFICSENVQKFCDVSISNFWLFFLSLFLDIGWPKCSFRNNDWTVIGYRILANFIILLRLWIRKRHHWEWRGGRKFIMNVSSLACWHWQSNRLSRQNLNFTVLPSF